MDTRRRSRKSVGCSVPVLAGLLLSSLVFVTDTRAEVPDYVIPIRWCALKNADLVTDPDLARPPSDKKAGFLADAPDPQAFLQSRTEDPRLSTDAALRYRSGNERVVQSFTRGKSVIAFQATTPNSALSKGRLADSYPILYGASWDVKSGQGFGTKMKDECRKAWQEGDALYFDENNDNAVSVDDYRLQPGDVVGENKPLNDPCEPNMGAPLERLDKSAIIDGFRYVYGFIDLDNNKTYDLYEPVYRYKAAPNSPEIDQGRVVTEEDVLLFPTGAPGPRLPRDVSPTSKDKNYDPLHVENGAFIRPFDGTEKIKYVDLIQEPAGEYSIGYGTLEPTGVYAVSMTDYEISATAGATCRKPGFAPTNEFNEYPVHGQCEADTSQIAMFGDRLLTDADFGKIKPDRGGSCVSQPIVVDDPRWMFENPNYAAFEPILIAHELGHALGLPHGDGTDNDGNSLIDDDFEDDCYLAEEASSGDPVCSPPAGDSLHGLRRGFFSRESCFVTPGQTPNAASQANMMQYCWNFTQDAKFNKTRVEADQGFKGDLLFNDSQYSAMQAYADVCGFRTRGNSPGPSGAAADDFVSGNSRRVYRFDASGDTLEEEDWWLDIGQYGYSLTSEDTIETQELEFRVYLSQLVEDPERPFEIWLGVDAVPRPLDRSKLAQADRKLAKISGVESVRTDYAEAELFIQAKVSPDGGVETRIWRKDDREDDALVLDGLRSTFQAVEIPSGLAPPGVESSLIRGYVLELTFPQGDFPLKLGDATSLLALSVDSDAQVADAAFSSGIRTIPPLRPGSNNPEFPDPTCVVTNIDGNGLEQMPRAGRLKIEARGLTPGRPVLLDANGIRVQGLEPFEKDDEAKPGDPVKTDDEGTVVLLVSGDQIPFDANNKNGIPAVLSVGAGASTAICGFELFDTPEDLPLNCMMEATSSDPEDNRLYGCPYEHMCETGKFGYVKPSGKTCPDGSLAEAAQGHWPIISGRQGEPLCLVPVSKAGAPNCFNTVFNLPPGASWSAPGLGLAYNFALWTEDGRGCKNRSLAKLGLDYNSDGVRERCFEDPDGDGIPSVTDFCPERYGFCFYNPETKRLEFIAECTPE